MVSAYALLAFLGAAVLPFVAADGDRVTVLQPCGDAEHATAHAIVPDAVCQKISDSGSFSLLALRVDKHAKLGFSATPDCKLTYTPSYDDLAKLSAEARCNTYVTGSTQAGRTDKDAAKDTQQQQDGSPTDSNRMHKRRTDTIDASKLKQLSAAENQRLPLNYVMLVQAQDTIG
ncbi:uncharacterized protein PAN0_006d2903 [Moesziomyces antarcticus]|uniref:Uncharacterized protein n=2 Tax=Pseudozyma antarctica TaxID=84753 RepID=A0A081CDE2_PSEA2|nr:uncharacterized protein PAN0_006d2903 [Moesziomyces antarcticus]GAK64688.1 hypothetical protein PAN0_006d2903 [Moesziomyces antarcticus]SPO45673.1 uncharacterized protein PSANT_03359 [Moesziomyces antarcticus]